MARKKTAPEQEHLKLLLAERLKKVRVELFGNVAVLSLQHFSAFLPVRGTTTR